MIVLQLILYCLLLVAIVRWAVRGGAVNALFFYPKAVQDRAVELGLSDRDTIRRRASRVRRVLYIVLTAALLLIIGLWNHISDFAAAYGQALLFLEVMNWFDGLIIDMVWVRCSSFWAIPGLEGVPYVQTWPQMLKKRLFLSLIWVVGAALIAGLVVLIF